MGNIVVVKYKYRNEHNGKSPRGLGMWGFHIGRFGGEWFAPEVMMFSQALKLAKKIAKERGKRFIYVLP